MYGRTCARLARNATATTTVVRTCKFCETSIKLGKVCESCSDEKKRCQRCGRPCGYSVTVEAADGTVSAPIEIPHHAIELRAYFLFEDRNRRAGYTVHGHDQQDWFEAVRQLADEAAA